MSGSACYLLMPLRTASARPFQSLAHLDTAGLARVLFETWLRRTPVVAETVEEIVLGRTLGAGTGQNCARAAALRAGWPEWIPACVVDNVCGAGLWALDAARRSLLSGLRRTMIVAAAESLSHAPDLSPRPEWGRSTASHRRSSVIQDGLLCPVTGEVMGVLCEAAARAHGVDRRSQEIFARDSHAKARAARREGAFRDEIAVVERSGGEVFDTDEVIRRRWDEARVADLKPQYRAGGTITAATTAVLADAAAGVVVSTDPERFASGPIWRLCALAHHMTHPAKTFEGGAAALESALAQAGLTKHDIDVFEIGEAFAAAALVTMRQTDLPEEKVNVHGGDLALGHPLGAAGLRMLVTLCHALQRRSMRYGALVLCYGGGGATAVVVERLP